VRDYLRVEALTKTFGRALALFQVVMLLSLVVSVRPAGAQSAKRVWRIGYLRTTPVSASPNQVEAFRQRLRELGYVEGDNLVVEFRDAGGQPERLAMLAADLVRLKADLIVAVGTQAILAAKQATAVVPIVMSVAGDVVGTGLVASLARPGGNVTGVTFIAPELSGKRLELLKEAFPRRTRVAVLWNPDDPPRRSSSW
jgi:putative ABC transport system substrate-binding protein